MSGTDVRLALISHTNVGKTSLTRTLLRSDVGEVVDAPHTTMENSLHALAESPEGDRLLLWDTPGFGDSLKLKQRLDKRGSAIGWLIGEVWDRVTDRTLYSSQQAMLAARDLADLLLYQVNAAEDPEFATQVEAELAMLAWLDKPVILLLNQLPPHSRKAERDALEQRWRERFGKAPVRAVMALDAHERSWIDEVRLLAAVGEQLEEPQRDAMARLIPAWQAQALDRFRHSIDAVTELLVATVRDREPLASGQPARLARIGALRRLGQRLEQNVKRLDATLIRIEGLEGDSAKRIDTALTATRSHGDRPTPLQGAAGGAAMGAGAGAAVDLALGGASLGLFTALGASLSAAAAWSWCQRAVDKRTLGWSAPFLEELLAEATARYLAVTHHGRGRGRYRDAALDSWRELADAAVKDRQRDVKALLDAFDEPDEAKLRTAARRAVHGVLTDALLTEYPHAEWIL